MGKFYDHIPDNLIKWLEKQHVFWVATAPLSPEGHVNVSPKGVKGTFNIASPTTVWYEDLSGSGIETISHLRENGRITIVFQAFEGPPQICRLLGTGIVHEFGTPEYDAFIAPETRKPGSRAVIVMDVHKVGTSCGFGVPYYKYVAERDTLLNWCEGLERGDRKPSSSANPNDPERSLKTWWTAENLKSVDGIPGLRGAHLAEKVPEVEAGNWAGWKTDRAMVRMVMKGDVGTAMEGVRRVGVRREDVKMVIGFLVGVLGTAFYARLSQLAVGYVKLAGLA